ncbi:Protein transport protein Sec61 subunit alpha [Dichanthelium oligosanthes]|uniref:Protein transport protein Sec61 subunit alpha n=1 Tax=Dichanthelium oligosanthes TaxID=888268 RepID=A0A1E5UYT7_9POAL|nr:Protein transport protein Sec61 subunit alpha [Dichanthelium oligosanthes]
MAQGPRGALHLFRPLAALMPAVRRADRPVPFGQRVFCTGVSASIFLMGSYLIPLQGVRSSAYQSVDPLYWVRPILLSNRGTLLELGVAPVVTARAVMHLLTGPVDREDRKLMVAARTALAMAVALGQATTHVLLGLYGSVGALEGVLIVLQLFSGSAIVVYIDEVLEMGYGLRGASVFSLLAAVNTIILNLFFGPVRRLLATCLVLLVAVFLHGCRLPQPMRDAQGNQQGSLPVNFLYTSTATIVLHSSVVSAFSMASQLLHYSRYGGSVVARLIGTWEETSYAAVPVGGLAYYVTPPWGLHVVADRFHALSYTALRLTSCAMLSQAWANQRLAFDFPDDTIRSRVSRYIPMASALSGLNVGALTVLGDVTGAIGSGSGILLTATLVYNLVVSFRSEGQLNVRAPFFFN